MPRYRARLTTLADVRIQLRAAALRIEQAYGAAVRRRWEPVSDAEALALPPNQLHLRRHPLLSTSILIPQPTCTARCSEVSSKLLSGSKSLWALVLVEQPWGKLGALLANDISPCWPAVLQTPRGCQFETIVLRIPQCVSSLAKLRRVGLQEGF